MQVSFSLVQNYTYFFLLPPVLFKILKYAFNQEIIYGVSQLSYFQKEAPLLKAANLVTDAAHPEELVFKLNVTQDWKQRS